MSDQKREDTGTGKYTIQGDASGASIPSLTRLLNRKSFKRDLPAAPPPEAPIAAAPPPTPAPIAPVLKLRIRQGRRESGIARLHDSMPPVRVASWDPARVMDTTVGRELPWLKHFAEIWQKSSPQFGGALLAVFQSKGDQWMPVLLVGEPPARLLEKGAPLEGLKWSEALTPDTFQLWRQHPSEPIDFEESSVAVTERSAVFAALGLLAGERVSLLPARTPQPKELCVVISSGRLPHELLIAATGEHAHSAAQPHAKAA